MALSIRRGGAWAVLPMAMAACGLDARGQLAPPAPDAGPPVEPVDAAPVVPDATPAPPPFCDPADSSLVLCMQFTGAVTDDSVHAQTVEVVGPVAFVPGARGGSAVSMTDQTTIHVADGPAWKYSTLSVELWMKPDALPSSGRAGLIDKNGSFGLFVQADARVTCVMGGTAEAAGAATVGQWTHVACVNDGASVVLYIDGANAAEAATTALGTTTDLAAIGGNSPSGDPFVGSLDELRLSSVAKTQSDIAAAMSRPSR